MEDRKFTEQEKLRARYLENVLVIVPYLNTIIGESKLTVEYDNSRFFIVKTYDPIKMTNSYVVGETHEGLLEINGSWPDFEKALVEIEKDIKRYLKNVK